MTIRLLTAYDKYPINAIVTLDAGTEAGLVTAKMASTNTTGGVAYVAPAAPAQRYPAQVEVDATGAIVGLARSNENRFLVIASTAPSNSDGRANGTVYIQPGVGTFVKVAGSYVATGGAAQAVITGTPTVGQPLTATYPVGTIGTIQWTRTLAVAPFTKTIISGAVANSVNSSTYTLQAADAGYIPGVDCSNQVSSVAGSVVAPAVTNAYARTQAALAAVAAGTGFAKFAVQGDSTAAGAHDGASGATVRVGSPVTLLRDQLLASQARPVIATNWIGDQSFGRTNSITPYAFDTRLTIPDGAAWNFTTPTPLTVAGSMLQDSSGLRLGFLPESAVDTFEVYYPTNTTLGTFSLSRTGATAISVPQAGTAGVGKTTFVTPLSSTDPVYAARTAGGAYIIGMDAYNSAVKAIRLFGLGWSGGRAADWAATTTAFDPLNALVALNLDLVVLRFGTNDISSPGAPTTSTDPTAYQASINKMLDALLGAGTNVILATHYPMNTTVASQALQDTYAGYVRAIATARGLKLLDTYARVGTWAAANAAGKMYDNLHPNPAGYQDDAVAQTTLILTLA